MAIEPHNPMQVILAIACAFLFGYTILPWIAENAAIVKKAFLFFKEKKRSPNLFNKQQELEGLFDYYLIPTPSAVVPSEEYMVYHNKVLIAKAIIKTHKTPASIEVLSENDSKLTPRITSTILKETRCLLTKEES